MIKAIMLGTMVLSLLSASILTAPPAPRMVTVTGFDYAFTAPDTLHSGATTFRFIDRGTVDHHLIIFRVDPGISLADFYRLMKEGGESPPGVRSLGGLQTDKIYRRIRGIDSASSKRARDYTVHRAQCAPCPATGRSFRLWSSAGWPARNHDKPWWKARY